MSKEQIVEGLFLRLSTETISELYHVLELEGYSPDPQGIGAFLSDVAAGKLSQETEVEPTTDSASRDILGVLAAQAKEHGPDLLRAAVKAWGKK